MNWLTVTAIGLGLIALVWWIFAQGRPVLRRYRVVSLYLVGIAVISALGSNSVVAWVWPGSQRDAAISVGGYDIRYSQTAGNDGFVNRIEFVADDGRRATFVADVDSEYCAYLGFAEVGDRIRLRCEDRDAVGYIQLDPMRFYGASCAPDLCVVEKRLKTY